MVLRYLTQALESLSTLRVKAELAQLSLFHFALKPKPASFSSCSKLSLRAQGFKKNSLFSL